ncbi:copper chaperone PCu(A)C [Arhodomonas sp. SL1]|uniref:copper chaperone PCu(A)C n=1 Tax=Arhodomonas sp. SL1 TaxID=3425691 RepID=UPI003F884486
MTKRLFTAAAVLSLALGTAHAAEFGAGAITVEAPWARATPPASQAGAAYFRVTAEGDGDRLIGVESPVARNTMLHETVSENGNRTMRHVAQVAITPDQPLELVPGGYHVMLMGLEQGLKEGSTFPLTLVFEQAGPVEVEVQVEALDAEGPGTDH